MDTAVSELPAVSDVSADDASNNAAANPPMITITKTVELTGVVAKHRNLFRFKDSPVRFGVQSVPAVTRRRWWEVWSPKDERINMMCLSEMDFDDLDITRLGQPQAYCIVAPGLAVCWPTADRDYIVSVFVGVE